MIILASRISHEKDPETVLRAVAAARARGLDAVLLNLSGGYEEFVALARSLGLADSSQWVLARPAVHPMTELADYMRAADALVQGSLEEGLGLCPLEALACGVPVVATNVGGMAAHLGEYAALTRRRDASAMTNALLKIAANPPQRPSTSSGSNLGPTSQELADLIAERADGILQLEGGYADGLGVADIPVDLLTASASGLDPHISVAAAEFQSARIAEVHGLALEEVAQLIASAMEWFTPRSAPAASARTSAAVATPEISSMSHASGDIE